MTATENARTDGTRRRAFLMKISTACHFLWKGEEMQVCNHEQRFLIVGFLIRVIASPFTRDPWDMDVWTSIGSAICSGQNPYALASNPLIYPPLWGVFCTTGYVSYAVTKSLFFQYLAIKLPIIIADILICLVVRRLVLNLTHDAKKARRAMLLYAFNPVTIILSSVWGMFDAIPALFALLSLLYLSQGKSLRSSLALGIGIGFKGFFPALLLPFFLLLVWRKAKKLRSCVHFAFESLSIPLAISVPFLLIDWNAYVSAILFPIGRLPENLSYWVLIRELLRINGTSDSTIATLSSVVSTLSFLALYTFLLKKANTLSTGRNQISMRFLLQGSILVMLIFYLTSSTVTGQYLVWIIPFFIIYVESFDQSFRFLFYTLCGLVTVFFVLNVGPGFLAPIAETPEWWIGFQQSAPFWALFVLVGSLFSIACLVSFLRLAKHALVLKGKITERDTSVRITPEGA